MDRFILVALFLFFGAETALAQTTRVPLSSTAWTDICATPCSIKAADNPDAIVLNNVAPTDMDVPAIQLLPNDVNPFTNSSPGTHVYARSQNRLASVIIFPAQNPLPAPFQRMGGSFTFLVTKTPQTYYVLNPVGALSYRGVNRCLVDVAISTTSAAVPSTMAPYQINGVTVPGVQLVSSATIPVDPLTATLFLARSSETLSSTMNITPGAGRYVSIVAVDDPGSPCEFRLGYGNGG
jgi:hypothetical protein